MKHFVRCSAAVLDIMDVLPGSGIWPCPSVLQDRWHSFSCFVGHEIPHVSPISEFHIFYFFGGGHFDR